MPLDKRRPDLPGQIHRNEIPDLIHHVSHLIGSPAHHQEVPPRLFRRRLKITPSSEINQGSIVSHPAGQFRQPGDRPCFRTQQEGPDPEGEDIQGSGKSTVFHGSPRRGVYILRLQEALQVDQTDAASLETNHPFEGRPLGSTGNERFLCEVTRRKRHQIAHAVHQEPGAYLAVLHDNDYQIRGRLAPGQGEKPLQVDDGEHFTSEIHDAEDVLGYTGNPSNSWCRQKLDEIVHSEGIPLVPKAHGEVLEMD